MISKMQRNLCTISLILLVCSSILAQDCKSPIGFAAQCVPLHDCKAAYDFIRTTKSRPMTLEERQFIGQLQCSSDNFGNDPLICCATDDPNFRALFIENGTVLSTSQRFTDAATLPKYEKFECGVDFLANRIFGGDDTQLNEFPWMALLEYLRPTTGTTDFACGGSLINQRYVLTAAHCVYGNILLTRQLISVRFGEYNIETPIDCVVTVDGQICAPPVINIPVESTKVHPGYTTSFNPSYHNDLGLVRLAYYVPEVSNIYPICLPHSSFESPLGTYFAVAGWGRTSTASSSAIIQKLIVPLYNFGNCQSLFGQFVSVTETQLCAGGENGKDSCNGDSGGPLMTVINGVWVMEGVVSFGVNSCGTGGIPGIYTRVSKFIDWIQANLES